MNRVVVGNVEFAVKFYRERSRMFCKILQGNVGQKDSEKKQVALGMVRRDSRDHENAVVARTYALQKALTELAHEDAIAVDNGVDIRRKFIW